MIYLNGNKEKVLCFFMLENKKFKELPHLELKKKEIYDDFIKNTKYIEISKMKTYTTVYIAIYREYYEFNTGCIEFSLYKEVQRYKTDDLPHCDYYEINSKKELIQNAMEERAVNLIIQNIIGDKYYIWK